MFASPMITADLLDQVAHAEGAARTQAFAVLAAAAEDPAAFAVVADTLAGTTDDTVAFFCLDALIKHFPGLLPAAAPRLVPVVLQRAASSNGPVADRARWALSVIGPVTIPALCAAVAQAPTPEDRAAYVLALRKNTHVPAQAAPVLALLRRCLAAPDALVRWSALAALMDMGPLRPWFDARLNARDFEPLYPELLRAAEEFMRHGPDDWADFAGRYHDLITRHGVEDAEQSGQQK